MEQSMEMKGLMLQAYKALAKGNPSFSTPRVASG